MKKLYWEIAPIVALLLGATACPNGKEQAKATPPRQANAPSLTVTTKIPASPDPAKPKSSAPTEASRSSPTSAESDPVPDLVARVEKEYEAGQDNYKAGHLDAAKQNFDRAFDLLLSGPVDVRADERLQKEFDHLLDGVNGLELQALQEGDGFTEQKSEPAPIDEANEVTFPVDPNIKAKAEAEVKETHSDLPLMMTDQVAGYINYFSSTRGRATLEHALVRSGRYHDMIQRVLKQEGVPQDLIFLAQAESGFHPLALSRAGARGMWQFMASRAKGYGLERNWWIDERQDPEKSTRAAARHLKDLYNQFGDWYLAMAAYNSGPGTVQAAVKRTGYADFWELYNRNVLPRETKNYVPIILAVTIMAKNPKQYGLEDVAMERPADYDTVTIDYPVDLRLVAECIGSTPSELQDLNPSLLRMTTPRTGKFEMHLPAGTREDYETSIASIPPDMRLWWRYHVVKPGDTLASLAHTYRTTIKQISEVNHLEDRQLDPQAKLVIPVTPGKHPASDTATYARRITRYKVRRGDTVQSVADNFGISTQQLRRWNGLRSSTNSLAGRRVLALHLPISPSAHDAELATSRSKSKRPKTETASTKPPTTKSSEIERLKPEKELAVVHHRVRSGETLYSIANAYRTTVGALKRDNRNVRVIRPGMILNIQIAR